MATMEWSSNSSGKRRQPHLHAMDATVRRIRGVHGLALSIIAVESSLPATFLYQSKHRVDRWCCDLDEAAHFLHGGDECIDLEGSASFEILQH
jgi:hypothetical protein